jgi:Zn-dependent peptidase ImmA (M78 family)
MEAMVERAVVQPELIVWARKRSGVQRAVLRRRFPKLDDWESGDLAPTVKQLEAYARATHAPVEWFAKPEPPVEDVPIPDRRRRETRTELPSADLLDTIEECTQRQAWYRSFAATNDDAPVPFVATTTVFTAAVDAASALRDALHTTIGERGPQFNEALKRLSTDVEEQGVLVMVNGVVGSNTHRKLDPEEFRGFALADPLAPVVFVNGRQPKAVQSFVLPYLLAHLALGESALCDADPTSEPADPVERWCHAVTLELLVPIDSMRDELRPEAVDEDLPNELERLAKVFKVSTLVALRRVHDVGILARDELETAYATETERLDAVRSSRSSSGGGNFYNTQPVRMSKRFTRAVLTSARDGRTQPTDAARMLGFRSPKTLNELGRRLGI